MSIASAREELRRLAAEAKSVVSTKSMSTATKRVALNKIEADMKSCTDEIAACEQAQRYMSGGASAFGDPGFGVSGQVFDGTNAYGYAKSAGQVSYGSPSLVIGPAQQKALFQAARDRAPLTIKTASTVTSADVDPSTVPMQYLPPILAAREPTRVLDLIPSSGTDASSVQYYTTTGTTGAAATAEGAAKPQSDLSFDKVTATATKIAHYVDVTEEAMSDFQPFTRLLSEDMVAGVIDAENTELLNGTGTSPSNFKGLLVVSGISNYSQDTTASDPDSYLDAIEIGASKLRASGRFVNPDNIVMHPLDYSKVRRVKDTAGRYVSDAMSFGSEASVTGSSPRLWNLPVTLTSQIAQGTVLVGNFATAAMSWIRETVSIRLDPYSQSANNVVRVIAEERIIMGVVAPAALCKVTIATT